MVRAVVYLYVWSGLVVVVALVVILIRLFVLLQSIALRNACKAEISDSVPKSWGMLKKHLLFAPLFYKRQSREFKIGTSIHMGRLPSRGQSLVMILYFAAMILSNCYNIDFRAGRSQVLTELNQVSGNIALGNMLWLFLLAMRNNPLVGWRARTHDTLILFHRWIGRMVVLEIVTHVSSYISNKGWAHFKDRLVHGTPFIRYGTITACAIFLIFLQSPSPIRRAFYEAFLLVHQILAVVVILGVYHHMQGHKAQTLIIQGIIVIWAVEKILRLVRLACRNLGKQCTTAEVQGLSGGAMRVKVRLAKPWTFSPGQYAYIYMPTVGWWTSHPFSIAWANSSSAIEMADESSKESPVSRSTNDLQAEKHDNHNIYFLIRRRNGFTEKLWKRVQQNANSKYTTHALVEGPYSSQNLGSYGTILLFTTGIGITHQISHVRDLVKGYGEGTVAARRIALFWIVQSAENLEWIREWQESILSLPHQEQVLRIVVFISRPVVADDLTFPFSSSVQVILGKPDIPAIVDKAVEQRDGAIGVSVCGVGAVADEVRLACRKWMPFININFEEESFSW